MNNRKEHGMITRAGVFLLLGLATTLPLTSETSGCTESACDGIDNDGDGQVDEDWDIDKDGYLSAISCAEQSNGTDCNDYDAAIHPGAGERCGDGVDNNCNGQLDEDVDADLDGQSSCSGDCDDASPEVNSRAAEQCDGVDNDCSGLVDDTDRDMDGSSDCTDDDQDGYTEEQGDCHDDDPAINPAAQELTTDGIDNDCNGYFAFSLTSTSGGQAVVREGVSEGVTLVVPPGSVYIGTALSTTTRLNIGVSVMPGSVVLDERVVPVGPIVDLTINGEHGEPVTYNLDNPPRFTLIYDPTPLLEAGNDESALEVCYIDAQGSCAELVSKLDDDTYPDGKLTVFILHTSTYTITQGSISLRVPSPSIFTSLGAGATGNLSFSIDGSSSNYTNFLSVSPFRQNGSLDFNADGLDDKYPGNHRFSLDVYGFYALAFEADTPGRLPLVLWFDKSDARFIDVTNYKKSATCDEVSLKSYIYGSGYQDVLDYWIKPNSTNYSTKVDSDSIWDVADCFWLETRPFISSISLDSRTGQLRLTGEKAKQPSAYAWPGETLAFSTGENLDGKQLILQVYTDSGCNTKASVNSLGLGMVSKLPESLIWSLATDSSQTSRALTPGNYYFQMNIDNGTGSVPSACAGPVRVDLDLDGDGAVETVDCDDANSKRCQDPTNVNCQETCDGVDNDCDNLVDDGAGQIWYRDTDGDGYGGPTTIQACTRPSGYVSIPGDCNDNNAAVSPGAQEICNGSVDDDCDGKADDADTSTTGKTVWYRDSDGDGYGAAGQTAQACAKPSGYSAQSGDCNDSSATVNPGASEVCNGGVDDDCDGKADDSDSQGVSGKSTWYRDTDGDGYGTGSVTTQACAQPAGYVSRPGDCNDGNSSISPGAHEVCNGSDDDCNGSSDDGELCDDKNSCTSNTCNGSSGCMYVPNSGEQCSENSWCYNGACGARFVDTGYETIIDLKTSLEWQEYAWDENDETCGTYKCSYWCWSCELGYLPGSGWRMPTVDELFGIADSGETCCYNSLFKINNGESSCSNSYWADQGSCTSPKWTFVRCSGSYCDTPATNAAACRCVRPWTE